MERIRAAASRSITTRPCGCERTAHSSIFSLGVSPIRDINGMVIGASKIARNVTEQERTRTELETARTQLAAANADLEGRGGRAHRGPE